MIDAIHRFCPIRFSDHKKRPQQFQTVAWFLKCTEADVALHQYNVPLCPAGGMTTTTYQPFTDISRGLRTKEIIGNTKWQKYAKYLPRKSSLSVSSSQSSNSSSWPGASWTTNCIKKNKDISKCLSSLMSLTSQNIMGKVFSRSLIENGILDTNKLQSSNNELFVFYKQKQASLSSIA